MIPVAAPNKVTAEALVLKIVSAEEVVVRPVRIIGSSWNTSFPVPVVLLIKPPN